MKKMKKLFAMLLTLAMVLGMSVTAFATSTPTPTKPTEGDKATATVSNVEAGATVTAYRIVEPTYNDKGFLGYKAAEGVTLANILEPTSDEVTGIAANKTLLATLTKETLSAPEGATGLTTYTAQLGAGYWVVVVEGSAIQEVYNPMLVGIYYSVEGSGDNNTLVNGTVDADTNWSLNSTPAYAKSEQPTIDKKITGSTGKDTSDGNESGNDVAIGDTVNFEIDTKIPSYSKSYTEVMVKITDTMGKGLTLADPVNLVVTVDGVVVEASKDTFTFTPADDKKSFEISFASAYALAHSGEEVVVTYDAVLGEDAGLNFDANTNTVKLEYTNDPSGETNEIEDKTYTYTFGIDANLFGSDGSAWNKFTEELLKTGEVRKIILDSGEEVETTTLPGAEFTLTRADGKAYTTVSDENGYLSFTGLDAGTYTLQETKAPEGYSLNDTKIPVEITATYNEDGTLNSYTIKVNNENTSTYTATYDANEKGKVTDINCTPGHGDGPSDTHEIKNTKLSSLPSTGGIGTTIFTIGGCLIMVVAAGLFFASRRKAAK
ncbi:MAG: isopeptide-forming domain-containing fimbrial protein [Lachnospiraceae bacterium]|jgi:fimbrial isopeptide formation D2 family protein/LPXTG-motif cell wall-anchored protein|nr:isopeptide-forming domain-containing fimbrial protein [Lachnospiraceae bacterium]